MKAKLIDRLHCALKGHDVKWMLIREMKPNGDNIYWVQKVCVRCGESFGDKIRIGTRDIRRFLVDKNVTFYLDFNWENIGH